MAPLATSWLFKSKTSRRAGCRATSSSSQRPVSHQSTHAPAWRPTGVAKPLKVFVTEFVPTPELQPNPCTTAGLVHQKIPPLPPAPSMTTGFLANHSQSKRALHGLRATGGTGCWLREQRLAALKQRSSPLTYCCVLVRTINLTLHFLCCDRLLHLQLSSVTPPPVAWGFYFENFHLLSYSPHSRNCIPVTNECTPLSP
jgi:hypothetical protein